jgi:hypothetical protein
MARQDECVQHTDHNNQLGMTRTCFVCEATAVPRPWTPGWTPYPGGWLCPACSRLERLF